MLNRNFYHNGIVYEFKWAKRENIISQIPDPLSSKLESFFQIIYQDKIPYALFNDKKITRCSSFRLKGLRRGAKPEISQELLTENRVISYKTTDRNKKNSNNAFIYQILNESNQLYEEYLGSEEFAIKPGHDEILTNILVKIDEAISVETPIWTKTQKNLDSFLKSNSNDLNFNYSQSLTGHIDLLLYDQKQKQIIVADYKPEGYFLNSMPQVASYGLLIKRALNLKKIKCMSFSKDEAWIYSPELIREEIEERIRNNGNPQLKWRKLIKNL